MIRVLAIDTSLGRPGAAVVRLNKDSTLVVEAVSHTKTDDSDSYVVRGAQLEHWLHLFVRENFGSRSTKGFDAVVRESYSGKFGHYPIFTAWAGVDRGLSHLGLHVTEKAIPPSTVKRLVVGKGVATKDEVEQAVRNITGYSGEFKVDDESDAVAVALAYLMQAGHIAKTPPVVKPKSPKKRDTNTESGGDVK